MRDFLGRNARTVVVAVVAAVVASVATAGAASLITGKQIKDGSITAKDLSKAVRKQIAKTGATGVAGPQGPAGGPGPKGDDGTQGPAGPGTLLTAVKELPVGAGTTDVLTIPNFGVIFANCVNLTASAGVRVAAGQPVDFSMFLAAGPNVGQATGAAVDGTSLSPAPLGTEETVTLTVPGPTPRVATIHITSRNTGTGCRYSISVLSSS